MCPFLRRLVALPGSVLGVAASLCFASTHVWAQSRPGGSAGPTGGASSANVAQAVVAIDGQVRHVMITGAKGDSLEITYANTGMLPTAIVGEVQVFKREDDVAAAVPFADAQIIKPGATQRFRVAMPKLAKGRYTLVAIVDYGGETMTAAHARLDIR